MEPSNHSEILPKFCDIFAGLCDKYLSLLTKYIITRRFPTPDPERETVRRGKDFQHMVSVFQQFITMRLLMKSDQSLTPNKDEFVMKATTCLGLLCKAAALSALTFARPHQRRLRADPLHRVLQRRRQRADRNQGGLPALPEQKWVRRPRSR